ncbi:hypothetical protein W97_07672 [Coniosporium apollinis CBS 100218]|uniref:EKC/KEOPS complex subunit CGI121 n=1 Tax=Coniosporium apollinis (strain CBS 100218) TaxID=1168221 RepID=R7Z2S3_CONA1|nr:uncharacterized protein W97_07672 [Coniosporium apollinis CBS 100218]EON68462.1 hypothetical protein W97_07672 [Coniosporium apollinis CBS 100218]
MADVHTFHLSHLPSHPVHVCLFKGVENTPFLRQQLLAGNSEFEYAFVDATTILSPTHLLSAVYRAIVDSLNSRLRSRNIHSEIVFSLSPNNNIAESFRRFGISDSTASLLAVKVGSPDNPNTTAESVRKHLTEVVEGSAVKFGEEELERIADVKKIRKIYKLDDGGERTGKGERKGGKKANGVVNGVHGPESGLDELDELDELREMEAVILGIMALKGS